MIIGPRVCITSKLNLENSPEALTRDARNHIRNFGYTAKPADSAWGLEYADGLQDLHGVASQRSLRAVEESGGGPAAPHPLLVSRKPAAAFGEAPVPCVGGLRRSSFRAVRHGAPGDRPGRQTPRALKPSRPRWKSRPHPPRHSIGTSCFWPPGSIPRNFRDRADVDSAGQLGHARGLDGHGPGHRSQTAHRSRGVAGPPGVLPNHRSMDRRRPHDPALQFVFLALHRNHLYCAPRRQRPGLAQCSPRTRRPARGHLAEPDLFPLSGIRQAAADAPHGHARGDRQLLDLDRWRPGEWRSHLGLLCGAGALGAAQVAAHDDLLDALHHQGRFRSFGGQGSALRHRVRHHPRRSAMSWTRRCTGTTINPCSRR